MVDVTFANWTQMRSFYRGNGNCFAGERDKFHFVSHSAFVDVDNRAHVTRLQIFCVQVVRQHHAIMFFDFHLASKGYAVINLGATAPLSNCQTERIIGSRPSGVFNAPSIS
jgi:hypothetical protein